MRSPQQQEAIDGVDGLVTEIERLTAERDYLDGRCAEFEKLAREFVEAAREQEYTEFYNKGDFVDRAIMLLIDEKDG